MSESQFEEFDGCLILPREVISEVMLAEVGGVAVNNCTGFGEQPWDTEVTASNIARWQTTIDNSRSALKDTAMDVIFKRH